MKAKLKSSYVYSSMRACGGTMFNKTDWTEVPPEHVESAMVNVDLEIQTAASEYLDAIVPKPTAKTHLKVTKASVPAPSLPPVPTEFHPNEDPTLSDPYTDADPEAVKMPAKKARHK